MDWILGYVAATASFPNTPSLYISYVHLLDHLQAEASRGEYDDSRCIREVFERISFSISPFAFTLGGVSHSCLCGTMDEYGVLIIAKSLMGWLMCRPGEGYNFFDLFCPFVTIDGAILQPCVTISLRKYTTISTLQPE